MFGNVVIQEEHQQLVDKKMAKKQNNNLFKKGKLNPMYGKIPHNKLFLKEKEIIKLYSEKISPYKMAKMFNCSVVPIYRILKSNNIKIMGTKFFNKGRTPHNKGKKGIQVPWNKNLTAETDERIKNISEKQKVTLKKLYDEGKLKHFLKNKTFEEFFGKEKAKKMRERISITNKGNIPWNIGMKGVQKSHRKGITYEEEYGVDEAEIKKKKIREARKKQIFPIKDTKIEKKIQRFLKKLGIEFFTHQYMKIEHGYQCDILIPSMNMVIECDGDYWHKYPIGREIDHIRTSELLSQGFKVLRLWEFEIKAMKINEFKNKLIV